MLAFCSHIVASGVFVFETVMYSDWIWAWPLCFRRYNVLEVGECKHASLFSDGSCWAPPYFANM